MKKSEMLKLIHDTILKVPYMDDGGAQVQLQSAMILDEIENAGMLPPSIRHHYFFSQVSSSEVQEAYCWEPEDGSEK